MDKNQTMKLLLTLTTLFPNFKTEEGLIDLKIEIWHKLLGHEPYDLVMMAVEKLAYENTYPPTVADIAKRIAEIKNPTVSTAAEGWGEVKKAISSYGLYDIEEALNSMSEFTREVVKTMGFREICMSENEENLRAQFRMAYESMEKRKKQNELIPDDLRKKIQGIGKLQIGE